MEKLTENDIGKHVHVAWIDQVTGYKGQWAQALHSGMVEVKELFKDVQEFIIINIFSRPGYKNLHVVLFCTKYPDDFFITNEENIAI